VDCLHLAYDAIRPPVNPAKRSVAFQLAINKNGVAFMRRARISAVVVIAVASSLLASRQSAATPVVVHYSIVESGQTATVGFEFLNDSTLQIAVSETTPAGASALTGGNAILTRVGFTLPGVQIAGGSVKIDSGSASVGFTTPELTAGADVSAYWGFTASTLSTARLRDAAAQDAEGDRLRARAKAQRDAAAQLLANNPDPQMRQDAADLIKQAELDEAAAAAAEQAAAAARTDAATLQTQTNLWQFLGVLQQPPLGGGLQDPLTPFLTSPPGTELIPSDGVQGGLISDVLGRGGNAVIVDSVVFTLELAEALLPANQDLFLRNVLTQSMVEYGDGGAFVFAQAQTVPEPAPLPLFLLALLMLRRRAARCFRVAVDSLSLCGLESLPRT